MQDLIDYIDTQRDRYIEMIQRACQQPSISTQDIGIPEMAELCRTMLADVGASVLEWLAGREAPALPGRSFI